MRLVVALPALVEATAMPQQGDFMVLRDTLRLPVFLGTGRQLVCGRLCMTCPNYS